MKIEENHAKELFNAMEEESHFVASRGGVVLSMNSSDERPRLNSGGDLSPTTIMRKAWLNEDDKQPNSHKLSYMIVEESDPLER